MRSPGPIARERSALPERQLQVHDVARLLGAERQTTVSATYPSHREADIALRDGSTVHVRPIRPGDEQRLLDLLTSLSPDARTLRFFSAGVDLAGLPATIATSTTNRDLGSWRRLVLTGVSSDMPLCADRSGARRSRVHHRRRVPGTRPGHAPARPACRDGRCYGITEFRAVVLPSNYRMLGVFRDSGFPWSRTPVRTRFTSSFRRR